MDGLTIARLAGRAAARMRREGLITPVPTVTAVLQEQYGGKGFESALRDAVLHELARRGGKVSAKMKKRENPLNERLLKQMAHEAKLLAFQRRDQLLPDP